MNCETSMQLDRAKPHLMNQLIEFLKNEDGPTAVEYAVMLAMIVITCSVAIAGLGQATLSLWNNSNTELTNHGF